MTGAARDFPAAQAASITPITPIVRTASVAPGGLIAGIQPTQPTDPKAWVLARVAEAPWLLQALRAARGLGLRHWAIGAGAVRNRVWDHLHGRAAQAWPEADVDLVFHDPAPAAAGLEAVRAQEALLRGQLAAHCPGLAWEPVNQAAVHLWRVAPPGPPMAALGSLAEALAGWPETATAVAVWLDGQDRLHLLAPLGLDDLLGLRVRRNPAVHPATYAERLARQRWAARWPLLRVEAG